MHMLHRLLHIESRLPTPKCDDLTELEWLAFLRKLKPKVMASLEPDFPKALAGYEQTVAEAQRIAPVPEPTNDPYRAPTWRYELRFEYVFRAHVWIFEILHRIVNRIPPVTEGEFYQLVAWFNEHESALQQRYLPAAEITLCNGDSVSFSHLRLRINDGPRQVYAGTTAEQLRLWKATTTS
jgi:hypothetical protein